MILALPIRCLFVSAMALSLLLGRLSDHLFGPLDTTPEDTPEISNRALGLICAITFALIAISLWSMQ
ncbi:MAG: hypothetical protein ABJL67_01920 [Sulfitobacter sp.]